MAKFTELNDDSIKEIRRRVGRALSTIFVLGSGCASAYHKPFLDDPSLFDLQSRDLDALYKKWNELLEIQKNTQSNEFLRCYFNEITEENRPAGCYVVNYSPLSIIPERTKDRISVLNLWGDVTKGICTKSSKLINITEADPEKVAPNFPNTQLDSKKRGVANVERAFIDDYIGCVVIAGASGLCRVTESIFNQAISKKIPVIVVNPDEDCFMHSLAHISLTCTAEEFFTKLKEGYAKYDSNYQ